MLRKIIIVLLTTGLFAIASSAFSEPAPMPYNSSSTCTPAIYVADAGDKRILKFTAEGYFVKQWPINVEQPFIYSVGIVVDSKGNVSVSDFSNNHVQEFDANGKPLKTIGDDGQLNDPIGLTIDSEDNIYVANSGNGSIKEFDSNGKLIRTIDIGLYSTPTGVAVDSSGNIYVSEADADNNLILKFDSNGKFIMKWPDPSIGYIQLNSPEAIAVDSKDNVFVADTGNYRIVKFNSKGGFLAKWGSYGSGDGQFNGPIGIAVDSKDNVYVADDNPFENENGNHRIQEFDSNGKFIKKWGTYGSGNDQFKNPRGIAVYSCQ